MTARFACPHPTDLERLLLGTMPNDEMEILEGHLSGCPHCLEVIRTLEPEDALVAAVRAGGKIGSIPRDEVDGELIGRLCGLIAPEVATASFSVTTMAQGPAGTRVTAEGLADLLEPPMEADELGRMGPYGILRVLGSGGMGLVCAARQSRPRRIVALKMILSDPRMGRQRLERFRGESEILARLRHPNIVGIHEVGEHRGRPYFTMEYAEGGSLAGKLAVAPLSAREAAELTRTLARTVQAAHAQGIVHRDLKPSNVLLQKDEVRRMKDEESKDGSASSFILHPSSFVPKIADFGLAKQMAGEPDELPGEVEQTATGMILGTPSYMAPEQAAGQTQLIGPAADVYALGAILYECLTGRPPFKAATVLETLEQVRTQEPVPPGRLQPKLPRDLQTICLKCLEKVPARRYSSAEDLADDLGRFLRGEPIRARPASVLERLRKWTRRKPAVAALLAVSGLFLAALIAGDQVYSARLRTAVKHAQASAADAHEQRSRADTGYRSARDALNRMLRHLEKRRMGEVPQLKELQRAQCEDALAFYQGVFAGADDIDPEIRLDAARAYQRAAKIQTLLSRGTDAVHSYGRAIDLVEGLPPEQRDRPDTQDLLASCYGDRGLTASRPADRERGIGKALAIRRRLVQEQPDDPGRQSALAVSEHQMGQVLLNAYRWADAETHVGRAVAIRERLIQKYPREERYQEVLAGDYVNLGMVYGNLRREAEAAAVHEKLESLLRPLIARRPEDVQIRLTLASAKINWALGLLSKSQAKAGVAQCTEAVELAEAALRREPSHFTARSIALNAHAVRAQSYEALGRWAEAVRDWDRVIELDPAPNQWVRRVFQALARARAGDHARAVAEAKEVAKLREVSAGGLWELARVHVLSIVATRSDTKLSITERDSLAERYAARAIDLLKKLQNQGFFKNATHAEWLKTDPDWEPLRDREDFRKLLEQIAPAEK
jgi:serine/threonine protein kinase